MQPLRVAILGAPGTGTSALLQSLQTHISDTPPWQLQHDAAALHTLEQQLLQAPDEASRQQAIAAHLLQPAAPELILLSAPDQSAAASQAQDADRAAWAQRQVLNQSLRSALTHWGLSYTLLYGDGPARCQAALQAIAFALRIPAPQPPAHQRWRWPCEKCSDPACEHRLFRSLIP